MRVLCPENFKYLKLKSGVMRVQLSFRNPKQSLRRQKEQMRRGKNKITGRRKKNAKGESCGGTDALHERCK